MIVLDTNVVSELMKFEPAASVVAWIRNSIRDDLGTTAVTVAEVRSGIERLPDGRRKQQLDEAAERYFSSVPGEILAFDLASAREYGRVVSMRLRLGQPIGPLDAQIAAICRARGAQLATRNTADFTDTGVEVIDPWV